MKSLAVIAALAVAAVAQTPLPEWVLQLSRAKHHLKTAFHSIPNYVCQETVNRFEKRRGRQMQALDTLHFEVAQVDRQEMIALPGAASFADTNLNAYNSAGLLGTGAFSALPSALFVSDNARIWPHDGPVSAGRLAFDYDIPAFLSGYQIATPTASATVGERGTFWLDAESFDLIKIEDHAVDIPLSVAMNSVDATVEYSRVWIGGSDVLLPRTAVMVVVHPDGSQRRNELRFSGCREYGSESTISFGDPAGKKKQP